MLSLFNVFNFNFCFLGTTRFKLLELILKSTEFDYTRKVHGNATFNSFTWRSISSSSDESISSTSICDDFLLLPVFCCEFAVSVGGGAMPFAWSISKSKSIAWRVIIPQPTQRAISKDKCRQPIHLLTFNIVPTRWYLSWVAEPRG